MKINFTGHSINQRETELSQEELAEIFEALKYQFSRILSILLPLRDKPLMKHQRTSHS
jgi:hypothetical protein